jgi:hypothetical protein
VKVTCVGSRRISRGDSIRRAARRQCRSACSVSDALRGPASRPGAHRRVDTEVWDHSCDAPIWSCDVCLRHRVCVRNQASPRHSNGAAAPWTWEHLPIHVLRGRQER